MCSMKGHSKTGRCVCVYPLESQGSIRIVSGTAGGQDSLARVLANEDRAREVKTYLLLLNC